MCRVITKLVQPERSVTGDCFCSDLSAGRYGDDGGGAWGEAIRAARRGGPTALSMLVDSRIETIFVGYCICSLMRLHCFLCLPSGSENLRIV